MSKLAARVLPFAISLFVIVFLGCDDYNIVEPRFYSEDDVHEVGECGFDPYADPEDGAGYRNSIGVVQPKVIPTMFSIDACWFDRAEGVMAVYCSLPIASSFTVSILNSGGGVEEVLLEGAEEAGGVVVPWVVEEDGVYAISLQTVHTTIVVWLEVSR